MFIKNRLHVWTCCLSLVPLRHFAKLLQQDPQQGHNVSDLTLYSKLRSQIEFCKAARDIICSDLTCDCDSCCQKAVCNARFQPDQSRSPFFSLGSYNVMSTGRLGCSRNSPPHSPLFDFDAAHQEERSHQRTIFSCQPCLKLPKSNQPSHLHRHVDLSLTHSTHPVWPFADQQHTGHPCRLNVCGLAHAYKAVRFRRF